MGTMTFLTPLKLSAEAAREVERACIAGGPDSMPWPTRALYEPGRLTVHRDVDESGYLAVPWEINGVGRIMATTATLMEREAPYHLQIELARGKVNQLRCQAADWQAGGLQLSETFQENIRKVGVIFGQAVTEPNPERQSALARTALDLSYRTADELTRLYVGQVFQLRHERVSRLDTTLACRLNGGESPEELAHILPLCTGVQIPFNWKVIEASEGSFDCGQIDSLLAWAESNNLPVTGGPVIDFSSLHLPDWLWLYERDLQSLRKFMANYLGPMVKQYRGRIRRWQLVSAANSAAILSLGEEELLWLTINMVQLARQIDPELELCVGISQPWGEYMATEERTHSPFVFADTLVRSDLNLASLDVEMVMGVSPRGSYCRDLLDTSRMLDLYGLLGVPLRVTLGFPSGDAADPMADAELSAEAGHWGGKYSPAGQAAWAASFASLALCKPCVQAVTWAHAADGEPHQFPHCGLLDSSGKVKPVAAELQKLREAHLR